MTIDISFMNNTAMTSWQDGQAEIGRDYVVVNPRGEKDFLARDETRGCPGHSRDQRQGQRGGPGPPAGPRHHQVVGRPGWTRSTSEASRFSPGSSAAGVSSVPGPRPRHPQVHEVHGNRPSHWHINRDSRDEGRASDGGLHTCPGGTARPGSNPQTTEYSSSSSSW